MVTHPPRKTRFRLLVRLYRTGLVTRRVPSERFQASDYPPFPSFLARGQFVFSGKNDELTPDFTDTCGCQFVFSGKNDGLTPDFLGDPGKLTRGSGQADGLTPELPSAGRMMN